MDSDKSAGAGKDYRVIAGTYRGKGNKCKYSAYFTTLREAIKALDTPEVRNYPWVYLEHKGIILDPQIR